MGISNSTKLIVWSQRLFYINAGAWCVLGILSMALAFQRGAGTRWLYSGLMLANALVMLWFGSRLHGAHSRLYLLAIGYIVVNILLGFFDQVGWIDLAVVGLNIAVLVLLILTRRAILMDERVR